MAIKRMIVSIFAAVPMLLCAALVDLDGNPATNETALADIDMDEGTIGDLKNEIAPEYEAVKEAAIGAVGNTITEITNDIHTVELISEYGIAAAVSNELE